MKLIDILRFNQDKLDDNHRLFIQIGNRSLSGQELIEVYDYLEQDLSLIQKLPLPNEDDYSVKKIPDFGNLRFRFDNVGDGYRFIRSLEKRMAKYGKIPVQDYCLSGDCFAGNIYHNPLHQSLNYGWCMWPFLKIEEESDCLYVTPTAPYKI